MFKDIGLYYEGFVALRNPSFLIGCYSLRRVTTQLYSQGGNAQLTRNHFHTEICYKVSITYNSLRLHQLWKGNIRVVNWKSEEQVYLVVYIILLVGNGGSNKKNVHCTKHNMQECRKLNGVREKITLKRRKKNGPMVNAD